MLELRTCVRRAGIVRRDVVYGGGVSIFFKYHRNDGLSMTKLLFFRVCQRNVYSLGHAKTLQVISPVVLTQP